MKLKMLLPVLGLVASLSAEPKILALAGSTRKDSANKKLVKLAAEIARQKGATVTVIDLTDYPIPFYDGDLEETKGMPENAKKIKEMMAASDGVIIATPEYNGSLSAVLKNTLDWISRTESDRPALNAYKGKSFALMSASPGQRGGKSALEHLVFIIKRLGGNVAPTTVAVPDSYQAFDSTGRLKDAALQSQLEREIQEMIQATAKK